MLGLAGFAGLGACGGQAAHEAAAPASPAVAAATPAPAAPVAAAAITAACAANEEPVFSCKFKDGKQVAVCGTAPGETAYRFGGGGGGTPELVLKGGRNAYQMYSGGGESQLAFDNGDTRYIVFSRMVRTGFGEEGNMPAISDGVVVERAGKFVSIRTCDDPDVLPVQTDAARRYLAPADDHFTDETGRADPFGNE